MSYPVVEITDITGDRNQLVAANPKPINLGGKYSLEARIAEYMASALTRRSRAQASAVYLLRWEGSKIPRGAVLNGKTIAWTQNGCVTSDDGEMIGTYDRLVEFGGASHNEQQMLVFLNI